MKLYDLDLQPGFDSMTVFHALAHAGHEGLVVVSPARPYVSIGYFQRLETSVDVAFCQQAGLGLIRREVGGGTTLLDQHQVFYQMILGPDHPLYQLSILDLYRKLSQPVIDTYAIWGIKVAFKEVNDLITVPDMKKISGEGGADIGGMRVFVGSILMDFDSETMSRVFPAPDETFRAQLLQSLQQNMSTMRQELGYEPPREDVKQALIDQFTQLVGPFETSDLPVGILDEAHRLEQRYTSDAFLGKTGRRDSGVKIASGVHVYDRMVKAVGGRVFSHFEVRDEQLSRVRFFGDFTFLPKVKLADLEGFLVGQKLDTALITAAVARYIEQEAIDCPGVRPDDFAAALVR